MYKCFLYLTEISKDCEIDMNRVVMLPFVPRRGITITFDDEYDGNVDDGGWDFESHKVLYHSANMIFECHGEFGPPDCSCVEGEECCSYQTKASMKNHLEWLKKGGWEVTSVRRGKKRRHKFDGMFGEQPKHPLHTH